MLRVSYMGSGPPQRTGGMGQARAAPEGCPSGWGPAGRPAHAFNQVLSPSQDFSSYLSDGLHLSSKGNEFVFSHLWPLIEKKVSSLPFLLPYWRDIAEARPELSLLGDGDH